MPILPKHRCFNNDVLLIWCNSSIAASMLNNDWCPIKSGWTPCITNTLLGTSTACYYTEVKHKGLRLHLIPLRRPDLAVSHNHVFTLHVWAICRRPWRKLARGEVGLTAAGGCEFSFRELVIYFCVRVVFFRGAAAPLWFPAGRPSFIVRWWCVCISVLQVGLLNVPRSYEFVFCMEI